MEPTNQNTTNTNSNKVFNLTPKDVIIILVIVIIINWGGIYSAIHKEKKELIDAKIYQNTKWMTTNGDLLEIYDDSCQIIKNGRKTNNECYFTINSNNSGVGKLTICNDLGTNCDSNEFIHISDRLPSYIYIYGNTWYKQ